MANGGIKTRTYKPGSIVYFENDKSDNIYILKSGLIVLNYRKLDTGEEVKEEVRPGEFFGVKSAIGRYPREETAQVIKESVVLVLSLSDFERLVSKNVNIVMKMLRIFSNQLRRIGKTVREVLGETSNINPEEELFKIGEYYYRMVKFHQAKYAYTKYLEYYPNSKYSDLATKRLREIDSGNTDVSLDFAQTRANSVNSNNLKDFTLDDEAEEENLANEIDGFLNDEDQENPKDNNDITSIYYNAMSLYSQSNYEEALKLYQSILGQKTLKNEAENKIYQKAHLEIGKTYAKMGKYADAVQAFNNILKKYPDSDISLNALYNLGMIFELKKQYDKARAIYKKIISMAPKDEVGKLANQRLKNINSK